MIEEAPRLGIDHGVERTTHLAGDDGAPAGLRFDRGDSKILNLWEEERGGGAVVSAELVFRDRSQEADSLLCFSVLLGFACVSP